MKDVIGVQFVSRAFYRLEHSVIINRLVESAFPSGFIKWIGDYLTNRTQSVRMGADISTEHPVTKGVPKGSVLGGAYFTATVGTPATVHPMTKLIMFIDDVCLCIPLFRSSPNDHVILEHESVLNWANTLRLQINESKCKQFTFKKTSDCIPIPIPGFQTVSHHKLLGVTWSEDLKWDLHFQNVITTASKRLYCVRVLKNIIPKNELKKIYYGLVRSTMEYCSALFVGVTQHIAEDLKLLQRRAHRLICSVDHSDDCNCGDFPSLTHRRIAAAVSLLTKAKENDGHPLSEILPPISERTGKFVMPACHTTRRRSAFIPQTVIHLNSIVID